MPTKLNIGSKALGFTSALARPELRSTKSVAVPDPAVAPIAEGAEAVEERGMRMVSIRMPPKLVDDLKAYSKKRGRPYQKELKLILEAFLKDSPPIDLDRSLDIARDDLDRRYYQHHLAKNGGSVASLVLKSGAERTALNRELKRLGVDPADFRAP